MTPATILWLRNDLRLADHPALDWAARRGAVVPLYIFDDGKDDPFPPGGASKWWLREALASLADDFRKRGVSLILRRGHPEKIIAEIVKETGADAVAWTRGYEPYGRARDENVASKLEKNGIALHIAEGGLLFEPETIRTKGGTPFKVYTPFSRACLSAPGPKKCLPAPKKLRAGKKIASDNLKSWQLVPSWAQWTKGLAASWQPGEDGAHKQLKQFLRAGLGSYKIMRNRPDKKLTSRLSPYLHFGHIGPRQVWHAVHFAQASKPKTSAGAEVYIREILWREFSTHLLFHCPHMPDSPLNKNFAAFPWKQDKDALRRWQKGVTGYPLVDAGMRELWITGWMHNRVRMIVASFLIKHLLIDWRQGEAWFWDTLVDADLANNAASWQWVAGCGADAAPYFRVFNPILQGVKFDPNGDYVRRYVPELAGLKGSAIHEPWHAPEKTLAKAGIKLGKTYPLPIIEHDKARLRALDSLKRMKGKLNSNT